jgi:hypothetical protein
VASVEVARQQWHEGYRRLEAVEPDAHARLLEQVAALIEELQRRIGSTFTLAELARVYDESERWTREAVAERAASPGWARGLSTATDAAFHLYARGARDYAP